MSSGPWMGTSRHLQPSQAPGKGGQGLWAPPSDGSQPWACLSGSLAWDQQQQGGDQEREDGQHGAVWSHCPTAVLWGTSSTVSPCFPCPLCNSQACSHSAAQNIQWVAQYFFSIAYENSRGGETLKTQAGTVTLRLQNAWNNNFFWQTWRSLTSQ